MPNLLDFFSTTRVYCLNHPGLYPDLSQSRPTTTMSDIPSWASDFDKCALQCLTDAVVDAGCSDLSDSACFCEEDAQLDLYLSDSLYLCLGLTCDPYKVGSKNHRPRRLSVVRGFASWGLKESAS